MTSILLFQKGLLLSAFLAGPPLIIATVLGLTVSFVLTVLQIQDQTLPFIVKLVSISATLLLTGRWIALEIMQLTEQIFAYIPGVGR